MAGGGLLVVLLIFTFVQSAGRIPFFTENFLSLLVLVAIAVQAYIYRGQWEAMQRSLERTDRMISKMGEQSAFMKTQAQAALDAVEMAKGQLVAMQHQEQAQFAALEETRKIVEQNERTIMTTEKSVEIAERASIYTQRAYVTAKIRDIGERDDTLQFRLRIENSGNTPANDVVVFYSYGLRERPPHDKAPDSDVVVYDSGFTETERLGLVAPNGSYHVISTPEIELQHKWTLQNG